MPVLEVWSSIFVLRAPMPFRLRSRPLAPSNTGSPGFTESPKLICEIFTLIWNSALNSTLNSGVSDYADRTDFTCGSFLKGETNLGTKLNVASN